MDKNERIDERGDWEKALSSKFADYEPTIPTLPPLRIRSRREPLLRWRWWALSISVAAALIFIFLLIRDNSLEPENHQIATPNPILSVKGDDAPTDALTPKEPILLALQAEQASDDKSSKINNEINAFDEVPRAGIGEAVVLNDVNTDSEGGGVSDISPNGPIETSGESIRSNTTQKKSALKLSLFTSGATLAMNTTTMTQVGDGLYGAGEEDYKVRETPVLEIGSTILFPLAQRWALRSGLKYSWYRIEVMGSSFAANSNQTLDVHSLGIPLDIQYTFYSSKAWSMYGQYGVGLNIPIRSTIRGAKSGIGGATISFDTSLALGLEYRLSNRMGLYTSFGARYDLLQMKSNLPNADISRWHGKLEVGIRFRIN